MLKVNTAFLKTNTLFIFSSETMEERYEHKTQARIQEVVSGNLHCIKIVCYKLNLHQCNCLVFVVHSKNTFKLQDAAACLILFDFAFYHLR